MAEIRKLADDGFAPAMLSVGQWLMQGTRLPKNEMLGAKYIDRAADTGYVSALFEVARLKLERNPQDEKALTDVRHLAARGAPEAQYFLGSKLEATAPDKAGLFYVMCAKAGVPQCQAKIGLLLLNGGLDRNYIEAIAWLRLAAERGVLRRRRDWRRSH